MVLVPDLASECRGGGRHSLNVEFRRRTQMLHFAQVLFSTASWKVQAPVPLEGRHKMAKSGTKTTVLGFATGFVSCIQAIPHTVSQPML